MTTIDQLRDAKPAWISEGMARGAVLVHGPCPWLIIVRELMRTHGKRAVDFSIAPAKPIIGKLMDYYWGTYVYVDHGGFISRPIVGYEEAQAAAAAYPHKADVVLLVSEAYSEAFPEAMARFLLDSRERERVALELFRLYLAERRRPELISDEYLDFALSKAKEIIAARG